MKSEMHKMAGTEFDRVLEGVVSSLFGENFMLKREQKLCIKAVCCDNIDVFAQLPTGFGKSIIYQLIPRVKTALLGDEACLGEMQQVIVVSPLMFKLCRSRLKILCTKE